MVVVPWSIVWKLEDLCCSDGVGVMGARDSMVRNAAAEGSCALLYSSSWVSLASGISGFEEEDVECMVSGFDKVEQVKYG